MFPYGFPGPFWAQIFLEKKIWFMINRKIVNKNTKDVKSEEIKVRMWFGDKDLSS